MVSDVPALSGVLILRKLAEKGSTTSGRPGIAPGRNAEHACALQQLDYINASCKHVVTQKHAANICPNMRHKHKVSYPFLTQCGNVSMSNSQSWP